MKLESDKRQRQVPHVEISCCFFGWCCLGPVRRWTEVCQFLLMGKVFTGKVLIDTSTKTTLKIWRFVEEQGAGQCKQASLPCCVSSQVLGPEQARYPIIMPYINMRIFQARFAPTARDEPLNLSRPTALGLGAASMDPTSTSSTAGLGELTMSS